MEALERRQTFCAMCAGTIDDAVVWRSGDAYCSYECAVAATPRRRLLRIGRHSADPVELLRAGLLRGLDLVLADADAQPLDGWGAIRGAPRQQFLAVA